MKTILSLRLPSALMGVQRRASSPCTDRGTPPRSHLTVCLHPDLKLVFSLLLGMVLLSGWAGAAPTDSLEFRDASEFVLLGKGFEDTPTRYSRLPLSLESRTRPPLWSLAQNSAGLAVRFRTGSKTIACRWAVTGDVVMNHFAPTGIKGVDLYAQVDGKWRYVNTGRPSGKASTALLVDHMTGEEREYMLYLPLYDGVSSLEIGVEKNSFLSGPQVDSPRRTKPVVFYGTSITQGGCASRPGMAYPAKLSRMLDRETINLGFSGNGQLDLEVAEAMASIDASCFVIDCLPNVTVAQMNEKYVRFVEILREKHPETPLVLVENLHYSSIFYDQYMASVISEENHLLKELFKEMKRQGDRHLWYVSAKGLTGSDLEESVDGVHLTDLGFYRYTQNMVPLLRKLLRR